MHKFLLFITILLCSLSVFGQESRARDKAFSIESSKEKQTYDFSLCENDNYKKCFKNIVEPEVFDFTNCEDKKAANKIYFKSLTNFIYNNLDKKTLDFFSANLREKDSIYSFSFTYYRNKKGEVIPDLIGSTVKRTNYEIHKKLEFLLSKTRIEKGKFSSKLKNKQRFVYMNFKNDSITNELILLPFRKNKKPEFNLTDSLTVPIFGNCKNLKDIYSEKKFKKNKAYMEAFISDFIKENYDKRVFDYYGEELALKYGIYNKNIKTIVNFTFSKSGEITDIKPLGLLPALELEMLRIILNFPKLKKPGTKKGKPINVFYTLPISFTTLGY